MKIGYLPLALLVLALGGALGYAAVDFSGTWLLDPEKSDQMQTARGGGPAGRGGGAAATIVIEQTDNGITIKRVMTFQGNERTVEQKFTLDGKECTNPAAMGRGEYVASATWKDDTLVFEGTMKMSTQRGDMEIPMKEEYSLSADGKVLTVVTTRSGRQGQQSTKQVFNKK